MNYDFSEKELAFFIDIQNIMQKLSEEKNLEAGGPEENIRAVIDRLAKTPYLNLAIQEEKEYNGLLTLMGAMEVVGAFSPSVLLSVEMSTRVFGKIVAELCDDRLKGNLLTPLLEGKILGAVAVSEDSMNVENEPLKTEGRADRDKVIVNGAKQYVVNAPLADWIAVAGMMDGKPVVFMVEKGTKGLVVEEKMSMVGYDGAAVSGIRLEGCSIDAANVIGPFDKVDILSKIKMWENQVLLGASLGLMKSAYEAARDYAKSHKSGGKPVIAYQEVGFKLAEMLTLFQTSQLFAYRAAWNAADNPKDADSFILCSKVFLTESAEQVASSALQILAG
ncbi:MAG: acyl-CoA dehydrogenase, partial [Deltaproteobacteria bacterium]|nr:acyl-CoA dehydrogenase [Deltaproteobacteria bacterium]